MLSETLFLNQSCENCGTTEYMEHDSGFYVCVNCAVVSQMRHGLALDYKDLNLKGMKFKRKNVEDIEEDDQGDFNNFETNMNTVNNTCANSEYNDSVTSRLTKQECSENKPLSEVLLDHQNIFLKIFKSIFYYQFSKKKDGETQQKNFGELNKFESCENIIDDKDLNSINNDYNLNFNDEPIKKKYEKNIFNENLYENKNQFDCSNQQIITEKNISLNFINFKNSQKQFYENLIKAGDSDNSFHLGLNNKLFTEAKKNYESLFELAKEKWMIFIKNEYENQIKKRAPNFRKRGMRSRRNTEDEFSQQNTISTHISNQNNSNYKYNLNSSNINFQKSNNNNETLNSFSIFRNKGKRANINEELKNRKIKSKNIVELNGYKNTRLKNKDKKKKFIEEHDQVLTMLSKAHEYIKQKTGILIDETVSFKNMLILAELFGIKINENATYEDIIHSFFITKELNYRNLYSEKTYDENKSNLTSDNFLILLYECFNHKINSFNKDFPIMIYELISLYKKFYLNLHSQETKFLKYLSKEKLFKSLEKIKLPSCLYYNTIDYISTKLLKMPDHFKDFSIKIFKICENAILKHITHIYNHEAFSISIVILSLRYFYGLNDLPYLFDIKKSLSNGLIKSNIFENQKLQEIFSLFDEISSKDKIFKYYNEMPSILEIIDNLFFLIKKEENNTCLWDGIDFKKYLDSEYLYKCIYYNNHNLFPKLDNSSCIKNINELEKKINSKLDFSLNRKDSIHSKNERKVSLIFRKQSIENDLDMYTFENEKESKINKKISEDVDFKLNSSSFEKKVSVKFSEKFKNKINLKKNKIYDDNSYSNSYPLKEKSKFKDEELNSKNYQLFYPFEYKYENKNNKNTLNKFLKEECDFYQMISKKNKKKKKIAIPLPCDTLVRFNKKAFKFEGIIPPTTELMVYYLFSRYFKIEVQVLRKCIKLLEKAIDEKFK